MIAIKRCDCIWVWNILGLNYDNRSQELLITAHHSASQYITVHHSTSQYITVHHSINTECFFSIACAFWMVFGGDYQGTMVTNDTAKCVVANLQGPPSNLVNIGGMTEPDEMLFSLFRLTLVDEYDLDVS